MSLHLLMRSQTSDFDSWKSAFDAGAEGRGMAGLTLMQLWREVDRPATVWAVFEVANRDKAQAFVTGPEAAERDRRAGVTASDWHFLETAF